MPLLNIPIYNKKNQANSQTSCSCSKYVRLQYVTIYGKLCFVTYKTQLMNPLNLLMKVSIGQSTQYKTC